MAYFPFFMDIEGSRCLIIGGGIVALRKLEVFAPFGPSFHIVAPEVSEKIKEAAKDNPDKIVISEREYKDKDLLEADFVIAATSDEELNLHVSTLCKARKIPVNVVDVKEQCSFIVPAILHNDCFDIAVSSGGRSPAAASYLKRQIRAAIPDNYEFLVEALGKHRDYVKERVSDQKIRGALFQALLEKGLANDCTLTKEMVEETIKEYE